MTPTPARLSGAVLPPLDQSVAPWSGRRVSVGGAEVYVRRTPSSDPAGEPALYVHGLGGASTNWTDLAGQLAPWLAAEAIDLPGFGRSGPSPDGDYSLRAQAGVVISYLEAARDATGRGPVHLFGNSMGGAIAIFVASSRPDLVRTLTLISPAVPSLRPQHNGGDPRMLLLAVPGINSLLLRRLATVPADVRVRATLDMIYADATGVPPNRLAEAVEELQGRSWMSWGPGAFVGALRSLAANYLMTGSRSMWARMAMISAPTLVLWGRQDRLVDVRLAARVAATIPVARLLVLDDVGHVAQMEDPVTSARAFLGLLEDSRRSVDHEGMAGDVRA
ncbi:MAG TPA: alpha/beta fold hydrolase [Jatrophihabitantaceae bacterium]|nr:alpha/beta fold hydrolase [Jatrophihabitantaceae bacterium]